MGTRLVVGLVCLGVLAVPEVAPAAAKKVKGTPVYQSPHFKGPKTLPKNFVPAKPPAPVALSGDGHSAHAFVDAAGTLTSRGPRRPRRVSGRSARPRAPAAR